MVDSPKIAIPCPGYISRVCLTRGFVCEGVKTCSEAAGQLSGLEDMLKSEVIKSPASYIPYVLINSERNKSLLAPFY